MRRYDRKLLRIALNVTHNAEDAQDAVQEAFFKAFQKLGEFRAESQFSTWLIRIALNEVIQNWRKRVASRSVVMEPSDLAAVSAADPKDSPFNLCVRSQTARLPT